MMLASTCTVHAQSATTITSSTFTDPDAWYNTLAGSFQWTVPEGATAVAAEIVSALDEEPMFTYETPIAQYTLKEGDLAEGVQYMAVQFKKGTEWGDVAYYQVQIDQTPPAALYLDMTSEGLLGMSTLYFEAEDELSGIMGYAVYIGDGNPVFVTPEQAANGYQFVRSEEGLYDIVVVAFDRAGNSLANRFPVFVVPHEAAAEDLVLGFITKDGLTTGMLIVLIAGLGWYAFATRRHYGRKEARLRDETLEIQGQMGKVFVALRDEIKEQVESLGARKRISKGEQQVIENLTRVLEVSETLIKKEVTDVKKILG